MQPRKSAVADLLAPLLKGPAQCPGPNPRPRAAGGRPDPGGPPGKIRVTISSASGKALAVLRGSESHCTRSHDAAQGPAGFPLAPSSRRTALYEPESGELPLHPVPLAPTSTRHLSHPSPHRTTLSPPPRPRLRQEDCQSVPEPVLPPLQRQGGPGLVLFESAGPAGPAGGCWIPLPPTVRCAPPLCARPSAFCIFQGCSAGPDRLDPTRCGRGARARPGRLAWHHVSLCVLLDRAIEPRAVLGPGTM